MNIHDKKNSMLRTGLIVIVEDHGRMHQKSFCQSQIWYGINRKKYKKSQWVECDNEERRKQIELKAKAIGWDVKHLTLIG